MPVNKLPNTPATAFVNDIRADLHNEKTAYVVLDNHKFGDYKPYLFKTVDGGKKWVNSGSDFTSGNIVLKPGQAKFANILWGPAIGYGSYENFEYDSGKDYYLRIAEPFGKLDLPLNLIVVP